MHHADGNSPEEVEEKIHAFGIGFRYIRCHMGTYGGNLTELSRTWFIRRMHRKVLTIHPELICRALSNCLTESVQILLESEIMHDIHERFSLWQIH